MRVRSFLILLLIIVCANNIFAKEFFSPDGNTKLTLKGSDSGQYVYSISQDDATLLDDSPLGFRLSDFDSKANVWQLISIDTTTLEINYSQNRIKQHDVNHLCKDIVANFEAGTFKFAVNFRITNNNVAFRYIIPKTSETGSVRVMEEYSGYHFPEETTTFLSPQSDAMIGWKRTKPSYEEPYKADAPMTEPSLYGHGYTFPCLFHVGYDGWVLLSETDVSSSYCASRIGECSGSTYKIEFPMAEENNGNGTSEPAFSLPGTTPWRTITVANDLAPIVETTIIWDLVEPQFEATKDYEFGRGTWSWILWQDESINYDDQIKYIDLAAKMNFQFVLIDNYWDTRIGHDGIEKLVEYAKGKGIDVILWYSSSGYWNDIEQGPTNIMTRAITRKKEMAWMEKIGVKGIKVDFFGGDKQETMRLYEDILSDANDHGLFVIFHGCTIPRGWERMYPNYAGSEAVLASENMIFGQSFCDNESFNACLHPFIRNAIGSMEFGGCFLNKHLNRGNDGGSERKTSDCFELATTILFQNAVQNFAIAPNNLTDAPQVCIDFLKNVPTEWDETKFVDGYPGKYVALGRRSGDKWYYSAINASDTAIYVDFPIEKSTDVTIYFDDKNGDDPILKYETTKKNSLKVKIEPNSGVVIIK